MCTVCGCGEGETRIDGVAHVHEDGTVHSHAHEHGHDHAHGSGGDLDFGAGPAHAHAPGLSQSRMVRIEQDILAKNNT